MEQLINKHREQLLAAVARWIHPEHPLNFEQMELRRKFGTISGSLGDVCREVLALRDPNALATNITRKTTQFTPRLIAKQIVLRKHEITRLITAQGESKTT